MERNFVAATELPKKGRDVIHVPRGTRVFMVSDELAARTLMDWSEPVQLRLRANGDTDGLSELEARIVPEEAPR